MHFKHRWVYTEKLSSNTHQNGDFCEIWQDDGYMQKKHIKIPWPAWFFYEIPHYAGYMAKKMLQIPIEKIFYAISSTTQGIGLKLFSIYPGG